jgi:uncharacterized protein with PIN domain
MLGSFARWLRLLGFEAEYFRGASDDFLLERAAMENKILLTRDAELFRRALGRELQALYVDGGTEAERLSNVAYRFGLRLRVDDVLSRCPTCGSILRMVDMDEVREYLPERTMKHYNEFWACTDCGQVYWRGGHWKKINETLARARDLLKTRKGKDWLAPKHQRWASVV